MAGFFEGASSSREQLGLPIPVPRPPEIEPHDWDRDTQPRLFSDFNGKTSTTGHRGAFGRINIAPERTE